MKTKKVTEKKTGEKYASKASIKSAITPKPKPTGTSVKGKVITPAKMKKC